MGKNGLPFLHNANNIRNIDFLPLSSFLHMLKAQMEYVFTYSEHAILEPNLGAHGFGQCRPVTGSLETRKIVLSGRIGHITIFTFHHSVFCS